MIAERMELLRLPAVRRMFEAAAGMKNPVDLSVGQPDFPVPERLRRLACEALEAGRNGYSPAVGLPVLRDSIRASLRREALEPEELLPVAGASGGLTMALLAVAEPGTEVLLPDPCFVSYAPLARLAGASVRWIDTYGSSFRLTPAFLEEAIAAGNGRRVLIFNSPGNPTGVVYSAEEIRALAGVTRRHGVQVISDEAYDRFSYDRPFHSWLREDPGALLIRTFGKSWAMTGWRCGYAAGPRAWVDAMISLQQLMYVCLPVPFQLAAAEALSVDMQPMVDLYRRRRDRAYELLRTRFELARPEGALYAFARVPGPDPAKFFAAAREKELLVVPGDVFSRRATHFRVSFAVDDARLERGLEILRGLSG